MRLFGAGLARDQLGIDFPIFRCLGQFSLYILSLRKQTLCTRFQQRLRERRAVRLAEPAPARRQRRAAPLKFFTKSSIRTAWTIAGSSNVIDGFAQEGGFFAGAFDQVDRRRLAGLRARRRSRGRESRRRSRDRPSIGVGRERQELERIGDVARPDRRDRRRRDQIDPLRPRQQEFDEAIEPRRCFT